MKKLSLRQLSSNELEKREMNQLLGGGPGFCGCGCNGPSPIEMNGKVNAFYGYTESAGGVRYCVCGDKTMTDGVVAYFSRE